MMGDFDIDLGEVMKSVENAEVISIFFPRLRKSLIIDTRFTVEDGPLIKVVPIARSVEDRLRSLKRLRPSFPKPADVAVIPWIANVDSLIHLGVWDRIVHRFVDSAQKGAVKACSQVLWELRLLEREEMTAVIMGEGYHTLWSRAERRG